MTTLTPGPVEGFLLDEDKALRDLMKGIVVSDNENQTRNVEAWFGHPDQEVREQKYPYITVDLVEIQEGLDRVHRGDLFLDNDPPEWWGYPELSPNHRWLTEMPTPVDLHYQIGTWARNPRHDREILRSLIMGGRAALRAGVLQTSDYMYRRVDYLGHIKRDREENGKRLFNNVFRLRVSSEVPFGIVQEFRQVESLRINLRTTANNLAESPLDSATAHVGRILAWDGQVADVEIRVDGALTTVSGVTVGEGVTTDLSVNDIVVVDDAQTTAPVISEYRPDYEYIAAQ